MPQDYTVCHDDGGDYVHLLYPLQALKNHLRFTRGSVILDHIRTLFLWQAIYTRSDLYLL